MRISSEMKQVLLSSKALKIYVLFSIMFQLMVALYDDRVVLALYGYDFVNEIAIVSLLLFVFTIIAIILISIKGYKNGTIINFYEYSLSSLIWLVGWVIRNVFLNVFVIFIPDLGHAFIYGFNLILMLLPLFTIIFIKNLILSILGKPYKKFLLAQLLTICFIISVSPILRWGF